MITYYYIFAVFVFVDLQTLFHLKYVGKFMNCPHKKYHLPSANGSFDINIKLRAKIYFSHCSHVIILWCTKILPEEKLGIFTRSITRHNFSVLK
jgi:hypothetical protein